MLDEELNQLLNAWSDQTRLDDADITAMLAAVIPAAADEAGPWIVFWQQIGRLIRAEQRLGDMFVPVGAAGAAKAFCP